MPLRSPLVSKDKQIREAMKILRENDIATDMEDIERELNGHSGNNGHSSSDMGDRFFKETMPEDACKRLKGILIWNTAGV